jgi:hypothetical protein
MKNRNPNLDIPLETYINGDFELLTVKEAIERIKKSHIRWVCPKDYYGWKINSYQGQSCVCKKTGLKSMLFGLNIHTSLGPFTLQQSEKLFKNNGETFEDPTIFNAWAARFNMIFKGDKEEIKTNGKKKNKRTLLLPREFWPFYYLEVPDKDCLSSWPAYALNPNLDIFVILDVDRDSSYRTDDVPWHLLIEAALER